MIVSSKSVKILFFYLLLIVICSINTISVGVAVLQIENIIYV